MTRIKTCINFKCSHILTSLHCCCRVRSRCDLLNLMATGGGWAVGEEGVDRLVGNHVGVMVHPHWKKKKLLVPVRREYLKPPVHP